MISDHESALEHVKAHTVSVDRAGSHWRARCTCGWETERLELVSDASRLANEHRDAAQPGG